MHAPKLELETVGKIIAMSVAAFLIDCGFDVQEIATCTPSANMFKKIMVEEAVDSIMLDKREMKMSPM